MGFSFSLIKALLNSI